VNRIFVLGAGGIGTTVGSILSSRGFDVTLMTKLPEESEHIARHGAHVVGAVEIDSHPTSTADSVDLDHDDVLLLAVKSHQTSAALERVRGVPGVALSLQNGIEKEFPLIQRFGAEHVVPCVVQVTAVEVSTGVSHCSAIEPSAMSSAHPEGAAMARELADAFSKSGMPTSIVENAAEIEWTKAAQWLPSSLLTTATGMSLDEMLSDERLARAYVVIARECAAVAHAHNVKLASFGRLYGAEITEGPESAATSKLMEIGQAMSRGREAGYRTSMELDLAMKRSLELDETAGAMERAARSMNIECPALGAAIAVVTARSRISTLESKGQA
jgi:2-dehydropantoate 2-reductase